jgi:membrane protease YdiL (CAAX protease family)
MSRELKQALSAFGVATLLVAILGLIARGVGFVSANLGALVAIVFLYITVFVANRRGEDLVDFGFRSKPRLRSVAVALIYMLLVFPIFVVGFVVFHELACDSESILAPHAQPGICFGFDGWSSAHMPEIGIMSDKLTKLSLEFVFVQVVVVALPEELFFRGLIHELCERALPPKKKILGGGIGWALVLSSAIFALGHLTVTFDPRRLAVFFPGLVFGWMRSSTGSILAGVIAHTASNVFILGLQEAFF